MLPFSHPDAKSGPALGSELAVGLRNTPPLLATCYAYRMLRVLNDLSTVRHRYAKTRLLWITTEKVFMTSKLM